MFQYPSYEKVGKKFKEQSKKIRKNSYKPDFVGKGWIMETKGLRTPDFNIKWKLFKRYLLRHELEYILFMPSNRREIISSIEIIKEL